MSWTIEEAAREARRLVHEAGEAALGTLTVDGFPHVSQVATATLVDGAPLVLVSALAQHTQNLARDRRVSLLYRAEARGESDAATRARVSLDGMLEDVEDVDAARTRFLRRQPDSAFYADFGDFRFLRLDVKRARIVGGFGRITDLAPGDLLANPANTAALAAMVEGACQHMDSDHADAMAVMAEQLAGLPSCEGGACRAAGLDALGIDIACGSRVTRIEFEAPATSGIELRKALVALTKRARAQIAGSGAAAS